MIKEFLQLIKFYRTKKEKRKIVFYSENESFIKFFSGLINELTNEFDKNIHYVTSSINDPILKTKNKKIFPYYIGSGSMRTIFFSLFNSDILILTMPDLNSFHIKRSPHDVKYIFVPHNILSIHMVFRKKAFNHYDTFFCAGPHHNKEIEETEKIYSLNKIEILNFGYNKIDELLEHKNHFKIEPSDKKTLIVSPSWGENCLLEKYGDTLLSALTKTNFKVIIRPHPDTIRKFKNHYVELKDKYKNKFIFEEQISTMDSFYKSSLMISDWSGAALEFALGQEKPVIFVDVPKKINNVDFNLYKNIPIEISIRQKIGEVISVSNIENINNLIDSVYSKRNSYKENIIKARKSLLYNVGNSSKVGAQFINNMIDKT